MKKKMKFVFINDVPVEVPFVLSAKMEPTCVRNILIQDIAPEEVSPLLIWAKRCKTGRIVFRNLTMDVNRVFDDYDEKLCDLSSVQPYRFQRELENCVVVMQNAEDWEKFLVRILLPELCRWSTTLKLQRVSFKTSHDDLSPFISVGNLSLTSYGDVNDHITIVKDAFEKRGKQNHHHQTKNNVAKRINLNGNWYELVE